MGEKKHMEGPPSVLKLPSAVDRIPSALTSAMGYVFSLLPHNSEHNPHHQLLEAPSSVCLGTTSYMSNEHQSLVCCERLLVASSAFTLTCMTMLHPPNRSGGWKTRCFSLSGEWAEPWRPMRKRLPRCSKVEPREKQRRP